MSELDQQQLGELLSAYLDDELDDEQAQAVQRIVAQDSRAGRLLEDLRRTRAALAALPRHQAPHAILEDMESRLERAELLAEPDEGPATFSRGTSPLRWLSMAAMVAIAVIGGTWMIFSGRESGEARFALQPPDEEKTAATFPDEDAARPAQVEHLRHNVASSDDAIARSRGAAADRIVKESFAKTTAEPSARDEREEPGAARIALDSQLPQERPLRLTFTVRTKAEQARLVAALSSTLRPYEVAGGPQRQSAAAAQRKGRAKPTYRGNVPERPSEHLSTEILVQVPVKRIDALAAELQRLGGGREVALSAEPFEFRGWEETRFALGRAGDSARAVRQPEAAEPAEMSTTPTPFSERLAWVTEALSALGVDQPRPAALPAVAGETSAAEPASPTPDEKTAERATELELADARAADGEKGARARGPSTRRRTDMITPLHRSISSAKGSGEKNEREGEDDEAATLVQPRREALQERPARTPAPAAEPVTTLRGSRDAAGQLPADEALVTLVIEVEVKKPARAKPPPSPRSAGDDSPQPRSSEQREH